MNQACRKRRVFVSRSQKSTFFTQWRIKAGQLPTCHDAIIVSRLAARAKRDVLRSSSKTRCILSNMFCEHNRNRELNRVNRVFTAPTNEQSIALLYCTWNFEIIITRDEVQWIRDATKCQTYFFQIYFCERSKIVAYLLTPRGQDK